jgi:hypothetical protein
MIETSGSWTYDHYWFEGGPEAEARQEVLFRRIHAGEVHLPAWAEAWVNGEVERALDWLDHLANLPCCEHELALHVCDQALGDLVHELSRMVYDGSIPGWMIQPFEYAPDDYDHDGYVGIIHDGVGCIHFCPWCGMSLPKLVDE